MREETRTGYDSTWKSFVRQKKLGSSVAKNRPAEESVLEVITAFGELLHVRYFRSLVEVSTTHITPDA